LDCPQKKESRDKNRNTYWFGIELKSEKRIIGGIDLHNFNNVQGKAEVGYWIGEKYWRKGYGSEALEALLEFGFKKLKLRRIEAEIFKGNPSSGKLLEKYNFKREGMKRKAVKSRANGKIYDAIIYGLLREEYKPRKR
jgi:[ribosomal protein S5]-alanine N-acetyltransferase